MLWFETCNIALCSILTAAEAPGIWKQHQRPTAAVPHEPEQAAEPAAVPQQADRHPASGPPRYIPFEHNIVSRYARCQYPACMTSDITPGCLRRALCELFSE